MSGSILFVQTNRERFPQPVIPLGLGLVAEATARAGHQVQVLDLCFSRRPARDLLHRLHRGRYDVVGFSVRNLDTADALRPHSYLEEVRRLTRATRQASRAALVIGGPAVSIAPTALLEYLDADYAIPGAGESAFPAFLDRFFRSRKAFSSDERPAPPGEPASSRSEVFRRTTSGREDPFDRCFSLESADLKTAGLSPGWGYGRIELGRYLALHRWLPVQTKRGCAFHCVYCTYNRIEGSPYRRRPVASVVEELKMLRSKFGVNAFDFVDATLNHPIDHAKELCEGIVQADLRTRLQSFTFHAGACDVELTRLMARAGFCGLGCSPDSASDRVLEQLGKEFSSHRLVRTIEAVHQAGLSGLWFFILGGPGETEETVLETIRFIRKHLGPKDLVMITCGLRIYPGTELEQRARAEGVIHASSDLLEPTFYFSPELRPERLRKLLRSQAEDRWVLMADTHLPTLEPLRRLHSFFRLRKPFWTYAGMMNRWLRSGKALENDAVWESPKHGFRAKG